ncbi:MAG: DUF4446 family protein, partial [Dehalococcoidia bacterium]|nr:DUF4446 family protein [Dehalococcoidia bacterium]
MDQLISFYDQYYYLFGLVLFIIQVVLIVAVVLIQRRLSKVRRTYQSLVRDTDGQSMGKALEAYMSRVDATGRRIEDLSRDFRRLAEVGRSSVQHVGFVRFNPFTDTGSDQSFSVALLDDF